MTLQDTTKAIIDGLDLEQLEIEYGKGQQYSKFQNEGYAYLKTRLAQLQREEQNASIAKTHKLAKDANNIASKSFWVAIFAAVISVVGIAISLWVKP